MAQTGLVRWGGAAGLLWAVAGAVGGCQGNIDGPGASGGGPSGAGGASGTTTVSPALCQKNPDPGPTPLMKLSTVQYRNTVRDLLASSGVAAVADDVKPLLTAIPDDSPLTFLGLDNRISSDHLQGYFNVAVAVGNALEASPTRLAALAGACAMTAPLSAKCIDDFLGSFGRRAFRRPLTADELTSFRQLNDGVRTPTEAIRAMVVTFLISPRFVNHLEIEGTPVGGREDLLQLGPYEVASRLSYTFWQSMPDDKLLASAQDGSLTTEAGFATALDRVFADPRTQDTVWQFWNQWFRLEAFTGFSAERPAFQSLAAGENVNAPGHDQYADMVQELRDLTALYTWTQKGTLTDLLTSTVSVTRSADLAHLYGVPAWTGSGDYPRISDGSRAGLFQRGALLVSSLETTNPFHRGSFVRRTILCDALAQPDPNSLPPGSLDPPPVTGAQTTRERYAAKIAGKALCAGCHSQFSDIGYVLEAYDSLGRYRTMEKVYDEQTGKLLATLPVDTTAVAHIRLDDDQPVSGPAALNQQILASGKVEPCLATNYFRYALRRQPGTDVADAGDACAVEDLRAQLAAPGVGLADVFKRVAQQSGFRRRRIATP